MIKILSCLLCAISGFITARFGVGWFDGYKGIIINMLLVLIISFLFASLDILFFGA